MGDGADEMTSRLKHLLMFAAAMVLLWIVLDVRTGITERRGADAAEASRVHEGRSQVHEENGRSHEIEGQKHLDSAEALAKDLKEARKKDESASRRSATAKEQVSPPPPEPSLRETQLEALAGALQEEVSTKAARITILEIENLELSTANREFRAANLDLHKALGEERLRSQLLQIAADARLEAVKSARRKGILEGIAYGIAADEITSLLAGRRR